MCWGNKEEGKALGRLELQTLPNLLEAWWAQRGPAETKEASLRARMKVASFL